jgi:hypothetical protein
VFGRLVERVFSIIWQKVPDETTRSAGHVDHHVFSMGTSKMHSAADVLFVTVEQDFDRNATTRADRAVRKLGDGTVGGERFRVSDDIVKEGRRHTSITHDVGHFALGHQLPTEGDPSSWFKASCEYRSKRDERDADILAIEHLTPAPMARRIA